MRMQMIAGCKTGVRVQYFFAERRTRTVGDTHHKKCTPTPLSRQPNCEPLLVAGRSHQWLGWVQATAPTEALANPRPSEIKAPCIAGSTLIHHLLRSAFAEHRGYLRFDQFGQA